MLGQRGKDLRRKAKADREKTKVVALLTSTGFWGGLSVLVSLISLAFPWWGIDINTPPLSWGVFSVPSHPALVTFSSDNLDKWFSANYGFMTSLVVLTMLLSAVGSFVKRWPIMAAALLSFVVTAVSFVADVGFALETECQNTYSVPASCIPGFVGSGTTGSGYIVTWGFKTGFYVFLVSGLLILGSLVLTRNNAE